ncbi:conserved Plasmodium protein, unknown function [Plasmodium vivax]|uniref:Uncharacterized protein n=3 Tax=Plasmodium vivax TaxID=5855 RepID=A0A0J9TUW6_PLAVI|nr:hypothetical protein PVIIG_01940 [Plasmodium vivax India VII]KMZ99156.1 hypothetical protein PVNG_00846 [Plasmodium vivax North Korean]CAG9474860.1 unnamed protein product [Plasmodium vivax]CAI7720923.1 conserved protein, unknown function [Plasmodium vivax]SCO73139.1 conserved Plasmodium protein, unknown function [Plasmodium vivax]
MGIESYFLKYVKATYITRRRSEMRKTIENLKNNIYTYNNYSCKNIKYHMGEEDTCERSSHYSVQIDEHVEKVMRFVNPLPFDEEDNKSSSPPQGSNNQTECPNGDQHKTFNTSEPPHDMACPPAEGSPKKEKKKTGKKNNTYILNYRINHIVGKRGKREQYRYTYLKSPFKYKYALRHYVFEKYKYHFYFYNITHFNIHIIFNIILSSMTSQTSVKCNIHWFYPGRNLLDSEFMRQCFLPLMEGRHDRPEDQSQINSYVRRHIEEAYNNVVLNEEGNETFSPSNFNVNLDLTKYNIQNLLPLFFENKSFSQNYKNLFLLEEKCFKKVKSKIRKKNFHWFLNKNPNG